MEYLKFRDIKDLEYLMTEEQKMEAKRWFEKYYQDQEEIMCISEVDGDGEQYFQYVDLNDFD